jgi:hypothetical protein
MRVNNKGLPRRRATRKDVISFEEAISQRRQPRDVKGIRAVLIRHNYVRMYRMRKDIVWLKKTLEKMGLNPEDWSFYT